MLSLPLKSGSFISPEIEIYPLKDPFSKATTSLPIKEFKSSALKFKLFISASILFSFIIPCAVHVRGRGYRIEKEDD